MVFDRGRTGQPDPSGCLAHDTILNSLLIALSTAIIAVVIAYALAFYIWAHSGRWRLAVIGLLLCPLLISEISVIFGWWVFLPKNGLLSYVLTSLHLIDERVSLLYHTPTALVGLIYIILPFSFFILLSTFQRLEREHLEASADLGAPAWTTFREVLLPQTLNGVVLALARAFIWAIGIYATPRALGPDTLWTIGGLVEDQMIGHANWPMASALAIVMILLIVAALGATQFFEHKSSR